MPLESGDGVVDAAEVDEVSGQGVAVDGGVFFEDGDGLFGAPGVGQELVSRAA
ncbi:hypothetical protein ABZW30_43790 [Kitasatospora sp. NPDC004669]|uniref:hypothetical protein n=1 Tax=Kitasatospora sp. NPDC004669 TaxID=3154555 RepID=UPI0033BBA8B6